MKTEDFNNYDWLDMKNTGENKYPRSRLKVGDIVRIKSREWYESNRDPYGDVNVYCTFVSLMAEFCGNTYRIVEVFPEEKDGPIYHLDGAYGWEFSEDMFDLEQLFLGQRRSWRGGADCKSAAFKLSRFESYLSHT